MLEKEVADPRSEATRARRRRPRLARLALAAGLLVLSLALGLWLYRELSRPPPPPAAPVHLAVAEFRGLAGETGPAYYREGFLAVLAERLSGLDGVWIVPPEGDPLPDLLVQADLSRRGPDLTLLLEVVERTPRRALGSEVLRGGVEAPYDLLDRAGAAAAGLLREEAGIPAHYRATSTPPQNAEAFDLYLRARELVTGDEEGDPGPALALAERALETDPGFAPAWVLAGDLHLARWRADRHGESLTDAETACRRAVELAPEGAAAHLCLAQALSAGERLLEAVEEYVRTIELDPTLIPAYEGLKGVFQDLGNPDRGERTWKRIIELHPSYWRGYWDLGSFYYDSESFEIAIEQYRRALALAPLNAMAYWKLGACYYELGRYEEAITAYDASIELRPTYQAYTNLGYLYLQLRRFPKAVEAFEQASALPGANFLVFGNLATAYYWSPGRREEARAAFERAAALAREGLDEEPRNPGAWSWLAYDLAMLDRPDESLEALERALELRPNDPHYLYFAARVHNHLGDEELALDSLRRAVARGYPLAEIRLSIEFDNLRDDPRLERLLTEGQASKPEASVRPTD
jgi:tetratricopeptide (TPR) repeat protein